MPEQILLRENWWCCHDTFPKEIANGAELVTGVLQ